MLNEGTEQRAIMQVTNKKTVGTICKNSVIELVADDTREGCFNLAFWDGEKAHVQPRVKVTVRSVSAAKSEGRTTRYEPADMDLTISQAMCFPSRVDCSSSSRQLFSDIYGEIKRYTDLPDKFVSLAALTVCASWFPELDSSIRVVIGGPPSAQGQQLFRLLFCFYRHPLLVGEMSLAALYSLPMELSPSLFMERCDNGPQLRKILRATNSRGHIPRRGRLVSARCATVLCAEEPLSGDVLGWNAVEIPVTHSRRSLPVLSQQRQREIAEEFQPKLLGYRLSNYRRVMDSAFDVPKFTTSVRNIARSLGACVVEDPDRQAEIETLLTERDGQVQEEWSADLRRIVLEAMLSFCHQEKKESIYVGEITKATNEILERRGEALELKPRTVGSTVRALGLSTTRLDASGRGILLLDAIRQRIHSLAWDSRVLPGAKGQECANCALLEFEEEMKEMK
jgi:hypothetical protein